MIALKILLLFLLALVPVVPVMLARPFVSSVLVLGLVGAWLAAPSWGSWLYVGSSLGLMHWRVWQLYVSKLRMSVYVSSPSMAIQNRCSVWLAIGAITGGIRSFVGGDLTWAALGGLVAILLFGLQGILFPNPAVISKACGYPMLSLAELQHLLDKVDYPTFLRFEREARKTEDFGTDLARFLEGNGVRDRDKTDPSDKA